MKNLDNFNIRKLIKSLKTSYTGRKIIYLKKIDSTNNYALSLEKNLVLPKIISTNSKSKANLAQKLNQKHKLNGTIIISEIQTSGRGRSGRSWLSPKGGLWFTLILVSLLEEKDLPKITLIAADSIAETLRNDYGTEAYIKWPNDIYYNNYKIGGILTECEKIKGNTFVNIGIGLNVNINTKDLTLAKGNAISIKSIIGKDVEREVLLSKILYNFEKNYEYYTQTRDFQKIFRKMENFLTY